MKGVLVFAISLVLAGCSMSKDAELAEAQVPSFHEQLNLSKFNEIYSSSSQDLKKATSQQDFVDLLEAVNRKLGKVKTSSKGAWNTNYGTSGTYVTVTYKSVFDNGPADEQFVYRLDHGAATLAGYHINSMALVTR
jgi:hypothetical protein